MRITTLTTGLALASSAIADLEGGAHRTKEEVVPGAYILQLHDAATLGRRSHEHTHEAFSRRALAASIDYSVRYEFKEPDLFYGLSVTVPDNETLSTLKDLPEVARVWPVKVLPRPQAPVETVDREALAGLSRRSASSADVSPRQTSTGLDYNTPHQTTGVNRLHKSGVKGAGVKIAIIDSGIDYRHPALGGCFGSGCKVSFGYDLVGDDYTGWEDPVPDDDPMAECVDGGHGTHVAGIIGMEVGSNSTFAGLTGVAPEADLGMYRVFGCSGGVSDDVLLASIAMAAEEGVDIITMSIGATSYFSTSPGNPYNLLIQGLTDRGIAVLAAAGNDGAIEPFSINSPANVPTALAVGSIENVLFQVFELEGSDGTVIRYGSVYPFTTDRDLTVSVVGLGDEVAEFGCRPANYDPYRDIEDKDDYVLVARRGGCSLSVVQSAAAEAGFRNILTYPGSELMGNPFLDGYAATIPATDLDGELLNFGVTTTQKLYNEGKKSSEYKVKAKSTTPQLVRQPWGGQMSNFSSVGPVWDFTLKPQVSAPGGQILATWPLEGTGFAYLSGTSMATPYLAGVLALVKSQLPELSVAELTARLQTTAKPTERATRDDLSPPVQQGAGLVNAYDAIHYKSFVAPGQLELGPLEKLGRKKPTVTVSNPTQRTIQYTLSHDPAPGMAKYPHYDVPGNQGYTWPSLLRLESLEFAAQVAFSESVFSLPPGGSRDVEIDFEPPKGLPDHTIPIYNGFITVTTDNHESFNVPYMGAAYNYTAAAALGSDPVGPEFNFPDYPPLGLPQLFYQSQGIGNHVQAPFVGLGLVASFLQPSETTRFDVVRAETDFVPTYYGFDPEVAVNYTKTTAKTTGKIAGVDILGTQWIYTETAPATNLIDGIYSPPMWDTETYSTPLAMPVGGYRLLVQVLKINGDPDKREDWETWLSGVIEVMEEIPAWEE